MPFQLFWGIVSLTCYLAFFCPKCQDWNQPHVSNIRRVDTYNIKRVDSIKHLIHDTYIVADTDSIINVQRIYQAHRHYQQDYQDVVKCSGLRDDSLWDNLSFYVADRFSMNLHIKEPDGTWQQEDADGYYEWGSQSIVLSIFAANDDRAVRHEILHALLDKYGIVKRTDMDKHPDSWFGNHNGKCAGLVRPH